MGRMPVEPPSEERPPAAAARPAPLVAIHARLGAREGRGHQALPASSAKHRTAPDSDTSGRISLPNPSTSLQPALPCGGRRRRGPRRVGGGGRARPRQAAQPDAGDIGGDGRLGPARAGGGDQLREARPPDQRPQLRQRPPRQAPLVPSGGPLAAASRRQPCRSFCWGKFPPQNRRKQREHLLTLLSWPQTACTMSRSRRRSSHCALSCPSTAAVGAHPGGGVGLRMPGRRDCSALGGQWSNAPRPSRRAPRRDASGHPASRVFRPHPRTQFS